MAAKYIVIIKVNELLESKKYLNLQHYLIIAIPSGGLIKS